jgi:uncharacterized protein (TIGR02145 family)
MFIIVFPALVFLLLCCKKDKDEEQVIPISGDPCNGITSFIYHGQTYHSVAIGQQCWMSENLNWETGNNWCYQNDAASCSIYGRLYDWQTIMNGQAGSIIVPSGVQGICPDGWHIPSDNEWKILEGAVDSLYDIGDAEWDKTQWRGYNVGRELKSKSGWFEDGNGTDAFGFNILPGGFRADMGGYSYPNKGDAGFWTSSEVGKGIIWARYFRFGSDLIVRSHSSVGTGLSVRCLKD